MKSVITFLLPGLGQLFSGDARKGGIMFLSAIVAGVLTGGLGYLACGAWSVVDLQSRSSSSSARSATATLLTTTEVPAAKGSDGAFHSVMPWVFKFSVLGLCAFLVLTSIRNGGALQSLEMFGVRLHFASLASEAGAATEGGSNVESASDQAAVDAVANALRSDPKGAAGSISAGAGDAAGQAEFSDQASGYPASAQAASSFVGQWSSDLGATYQISEQDGLVMIVETSKILFVPFISMTCYGQSSGAYVSAECETYDGQTGELVLARNDIGGLGGIFTAHANGMEIPLNLRR